MFRPRSRDFIQNLLFSSSIKAQVHPEKYGFKKYIELFVNVVVLNLHWSIVTFMLIICTSIIVISNQFSILHNFFFFNFSQILFYLLLTKIQHNMHPSIYNSDSHAHPCGFRDRKKNTFIRKSLFHLFFFFGMLNSWCAFFSRIFILFCKLHRGLLFPF